MGKGKFDGWALGAIAMGLGSAVFGLCKGFHDKKVTEQRQSEEITKAVENYFNNSTKALDGVVDKD